MLRTIRKIYNKIFEKGKLMKISTGLTDLDKKLNGGFDCPSVVTIGARPAMGKSALLHGILREMTKNKINFALFSLDCSKAQIAEREEKFYRDEINIPQERIFYLDSIAKIISLMRYLSQDGVKVFAIDYIQLLMNYSNEPYQECSNILNLLKIASLELNVLIILTSQLSRKVEERVSHRPRLTDLKDSGAIEEVSDLVLLILRRAYYDANDKPGRAEIIIEKNRFGQVGSVDLCFDSERISFGNFYPISLSKEEEQEAIERCFTQFMPA
jgi:replicative DNA helicase